MAKKRKHRHVFLSDVRLIRGEPICQAFLLCRFDANDSIWLAGKHQISMLTHE